MAPVSCLPGPPSVYLPRRLPWPCRVEAARDALGQAAATAARKWLCGDQHAEDEAQEPCAFFVDFRDSFSPADELAVDGFFYNSFLNSGFPLLSFCETLFRR